MAVLDEDLGAGLRLVEGDDGIWSSPEAASASAARDWRSEYERERERADAAEARCEELRRSDIDARSRAGSLKWQFDSCRGKLEASRAEVKDLRRALQEARCSAKAETPRRGGRRPGSPVEPAGRLPAVSAAEVDWLRKDLKATQAQAATAGVLEYEIGELRKALQGAERHKETIRSLNGEIALLVAELRRLRDQKEVVKSLSGETYRLRVALEVTEARKEKLTARLAKLRAVGATLSKLPFDRAAQMRTALRRSRRQKTTIKTLSRENARLRKRAKASRNRIETLEAQLARLRATGAVLSKALFGRKSEKQETPRSGRKRGRQRGAPGHGRTQRPGLDERTETLTPPEDARVCSCCGKAYVANGADESTLIEIEVKAHKRVIRRPRWRRACNCASSPMEVSAPPAPRLFPRTLFGTSFWARFLFEHCACYRPLHRVAAWMAGQGLPVSPGTLANSLKRFVALFQPLADAILAHQNAAALRHADETTWRVQELGAEDRSSRAWLWTSVSSDAVSFHIDPSRSAEAALELFGDAPPDTVIVCDRYSAYKRLVRLRGGQMTLSYCWSHQRRDFIECAAGQVKLTPWCQGWIERIAELYRLNEARLEHYDPGRKAQTPVFDAAQGALKETLDGLFTEAERQLAELDDGAREGKALRSLLNHREGLCVFLDRPQAPLDNNLAERMLRGPAIGRRLSFGSDSRTGARFTAVMYSVIGTLALNRIDILRWLRAWLDACAKNGGKPPDDLSPWLPWSMSEEDRQGFMAAE